MKVIKVLKNGLGEYSIWWGIQNEDNPEGKAKHLAYKRFFKDINTANKWAEKFHKKLTK